jgi:hypothetical protein
MFAHWERQTQIPGVAMMNGTIESMGRLSMPGPEGGFANETNAPILFIFEKMLRVNPCKPDLTWDSFESCSGKAIEENCS